MEQSELLELMQGRRSIRKFTDEPLPPDAVERLLTAFIWAPNGGNAQAWRVIVVRSVAAREKLAAAALSQRFVGQAPVALVVCVDLERARIAYGERGVSLYCLQDTAAAIQNVLLTAHAMGLGSCWVGAFREWSVAEALDLPPHLRPIAVLPVGWPAEHPHAPSRRSVREISEER